VLATGELLVEVELADAAVVVTLAVVPGLNLTYFRDEFS
jgi:hypothetical protein